MLPLQPLENALGLFELTFFLKLQEVDYAYHKI
jgi:hypothetical protein